MLKSVEKLNELQIDKENVVYLSPWFLLLFIDRVPFRVSVNLDARWHTSLSFSVSIWEVSDTSPTICPDIFSFVDFVYLIVCIDRPFRGHA